MFQFDVLMYGLKAKQRLSFSEDRIKKYQMERFRILAKYAYTHSSYYRDIIHTHGIHLETCRPEDFPILTKQILIINFDTIVTHNEIKKSLIEQFLVASKDTNELYLGKYYVIHTSGSSGQIGYYLSTEKEMAEALSVSSRIDGIKWGQKLAFIGATAGHFAGVTMVHCAKKLPLNYSHVESYNINQPFKNIIKNLNTFKPTILSGYAFVLVQFAHAQKAGQLNIKPNLIQVGGEPLLRTDKEFIQDVFQVPVVNTYASSEHIFMGIGRDDYGGMYLMNDLLYIEPQSSSTLVTNLYNYTLPLIRYQMNDVLEVIRDGNKKWPLTLVKDVVGRNEMTPFFINNLGLLDFISPHIINEFFVSGVRFFQMVVESDKSFIFLVVLDPALDISNRAITLKAVKDWLHSILTEKEMEKSIQFRIQEVTKLSHDSKTGKFRLIMKQ